MLIAGGWMWVQSYLSQGWGLFLPSDGAVLGTMNNVTVYAKNGPSHRGKYGLEFECVELVNRAYVEKLGHKNMAKMGHADSYFWEPFNKDLVANKNGGTIPPQMDDILVFDNGPEDGSVGHVGLITEVNVQEGIIHFVQQNFVIHHKNHLFKKFLWQDSLHLRHDGLKWWVDVHSPYPWPVAGWSRQHLAKGN
jgi:hypothetical protein